MPNIEIHGFRPGIRSDIRLSEVFEIINVAVRELGLAEDAIITTLLSEVNNCDGSDRPAQFIRIASTDSTETERIIRALKEKQIGIDVETLHLTGFISADEMK